MTAFNTPLIKHIYRALFELWIFAIGWKFQGQKPKTDKFVLVCAPHTSNWDVVFLLAVAFHFGFDIKWLGKHSLFTGLLGLLIRYIGGVPVDRTQSTNLVERSVDIIHEHKRFVLAIAPEGTRSSVKKWRSGFYHIAKGADIPIVLGFIDYNRKIVGLGPHFDQFTHAETDIPKMQKFYHDFLGKGGQRSLN